MKHSFFTGIGTREQNEDVILIEQLNQNNTLYLVVDGMGGYEKGEVAAKLVADNIATYLRSILEIDFAHIQNAVNKSNLAIKQYNKINQITSGATLGGIIVSGNSALCFWLGDVKLYYLKNNKLVQESQSHSFLNEMSDSDFSKTSENLKRYGHIVTRSVSGKRDKTTLDFFQIDNLSGQDSFIICSDGVHNSMTIEHMSLLLSNAADTSGIEDYLNTHAKDNFSLVIINF